MGPSESGSSLGAIESHVRLTPARGPSSSSRLKVAKKEPEPKPKTLMESIQAIGLPILIGVGGGLLLVLVIILLFLFSGDSQEVSQRPQARNAARWCAARTVSAGRCAAPAAAAAPNLAADAACPASGDAGRAVAPAGNACAKPLDIPAATAPKTPDASAGPQQPGPSKPTESPAEIGKQASDGPKTEPKTTVPAEPVRPAVAAPKPSPPDTIPAKPEPAPKPEKTPRERRQPQTPQRSKEELFAELKQFGLAVEFKFVGGDAKPPKQLVPIMDEFRLTLRNTLEQMVSVKTVGLQVVDDTSQAVMEVVITPRVDQALVFDASAKLKCQTGQEWIELWSKPEAELVRFMPQGQPTQIKRSLDREDPRLLSGFPHAQAV